MVMAAAISYHFVELPIRRKELPRTRLKTVFIGFGSSVVASLLLLSLITFNHGRIFLGGNSREQGLADSQILPSYKEIVESSRELIENCNMTPQFLTGDSYRPKPIVDSTFINRCINSHDGSNKILLVGDSFAQVSAAHLSIIAHNIGYDFRAITGYGCPYPLPFNKIISSNGQECRHVDEELLWNEIVNSLNSGDLLIIRLYLSKKQYIDYKNQNLPPPEAYDRALIELARSVAEKDGPAPA